jgi:hypothetical protein
MVGRINGNTLVHVVNTNTTSLADTDSQGNIVPFIWSNIYGGCAFGTVNGSTLVHIEGGKLGHNIYGGGYGNIQIDLKTYSDFEKQIYNDFLKVSKDDKKLYFGSVTGSNPGDPDFDPMTFKRYHASRWAWTLGLPGFTFQAIHGGGFSGYVTGETYVETDCQPFCENIFGAGVGAMPIGNITTANQGESYDFGKVGSLSRVFIKSGYVAQNVYGGGAGIESIYDKNQNTWIDFPNMATTFRAM